MKNDDDDEAAAAAKKKKMLSRMKLKARRRMINQKVKHSLERANQAAVDFYASVMAAGEGKSPNREEEEERERESSRGIAEKERSTQQKKEKRKPPPSRLDKIKVTATGGMTVATHNVRTLKLTRGQMDDKLDVLATYCAAHNIDVLGLQETRTHDDLSYWLPGREYYFISVRGTKEGNYGVGVLLSARAAKSLKTTRTVIDHRVLELIIGDVTVLVVYAPCCGDAARLEKRDEFFQELAISCTDCSPVSNEPTTIEHCTCIPTRPIFHEQAASPIILSNSHHSQPSSTSATSQPNRGRSTPCPDEMNIDDENDANLSILPPAASTSLGQPSRAHPPARDCIVCTRRKESRSIRSNDHPRTKFRVLLGDFNSDLSRSDAASEQLEGFLEPLGLVATAQSLNQWRPTWKSNDGITSKVLDYIIVPKRFASAVTKLFVDDPVVESDHMVVRAFMKVKWREKAKPRKPQGDSTPLSLWDYSKMACNKEAREEFDKEFSEIYFSDDFVKGTLLGPDDPTTKIARLKEALDACAEHVLPLKLNNGPKMKSNVPSLLPLLQKMENDTKVDLKTQTDLLRSARSANHEQATAMVWDYVSTITRSKDPWHAWQHIFAMRKEGIQKEAEALDLIKLETHFSRLFRKEKEGDFDEPPPGFKLPDDPPWGDDGVRPYISDKPISLDELADAANSQSNHKSNGPDGINVEVLKCEAVRAALLPILNAALEDADEIPESFFDAYLIALHKKGLIDDPNNYRGISLMSHVAKLFHLVIMRRIRKGLDLDISPSQNAYRPSRGCHQHTVAATALYHAAKNHPAYQLHMVFVDYSKAFDSVDRAAMEKILKWWGIPDKLLKVIMRMLKEHKLFIRYLGEVSKNPVQPTFGILQGDTLAPLIFILCMDYILKQLKPEWGAVIQNGADKGTERTKKNKQLKRISNLAYADDVVLLANTTEHAQKQFELFQQLSLHIGMKVNLGKGKTEEIRVNVDPDDPPLRTLDGRAVSQVDTYKYLGTMIGQTWDVDFKRRTKLAWGVIREFDRVWKSEASFDSRKGLFIALVEPILLYGAFTYPNTQEVDETLHRCHARMLRSCVGLGRVDPRRGNYLPTEFLYYGRNVARGKTWKSATLTLPAAVARQKLSALGHWCRDHFQRHRVHPVIDVLNFDPSLGYMRAANAKRSVRDAFEALVPQRRGHGKLELSKNVFIPGTGAESMTADRHSWYDECKNRVKHLETDFMQRILRRRLEDPKRENFGVTQYRTAMKELKDGKNFTNRWLTSKTRKDPLGEDATRHPPRRKKRNNDDLSL